MILTKKNVTAFVIQIAHLAVRESKVINVMGSESMRATYILFDTVNEDEQDYFEISFLYGEPQSVLFYTAPECRGGIQENHMKVNNARDVYDSLLSVLKEQYSSILILN